MFQKRRLIFERFAGLDPHKATDSKPSISDGGNRQSQVSCVHANIGIPFQLPLDRFQRIDVESRNIASPSG
jgi:hypothetical protein